MVSCDVVYCLDKHLCTVIKSEKFNFVLETFPVEGPSEQYHLGFSDSGDFRPTQTGVHGVVEPHSSRKRGQMKHLCNTAEQRIGK